MLKVLHCGSGNLYGGIETLRHPRWPAGAEFGLASTPSSPSASRGGWPGGAAGERGARSTT